jgi:hypothetical protein
MKLLKHTINGCRDLPGFGPHPGTGVLLIVILVGGLAGVDKGGVNGFIGGAAFSFLMTMPLYLHGAYSRGKLYEQSKVRLMKEIKDA